MPDSSTSQKLASVRNRVRSAEDASADIESISAFDADTLDSISRDLTNALSELDKLTN